jgi:hypothetical protein
MKHLFLFILLATVQLVNAQEVNKKNWTLVHERTASWCPNCGTWGWNLKNRFIDDFKNENVVFVAAHHSGDLVNSTSTEFGNNFAGGGQPIFYVDGFNINANSSNINTKIEETKLEVQFKKDVTVIAGIGINANINESAKTIKADAKVEFLSDVESGDYYFGMYLLEDVLNTQASRTGQQLHKNVLRKSFLAKTFDNPLKAGQIKSGTVFNLSGTLDNATAAKENYKVLGVIWTKVNGKYIFFNAFVTDVKSTSSTENPTIGSNEFNVYQAESGNLVVNFDDQTNLSKDAVISVTDISGKLIKVVNINGLHTKSISIEADYQQGMHVVTLTSGTQKTSKKIVLL